MRRSILTITMAGAVVVMLIVPREVEETQTTVTTTSIILPRPVQILMPNNLCDNMQGALMFHFQAWKEAPQASRPKWLERMEQIRQDMRDTGCG